MIPSDSMIDAQDLEVVIYPTPNFNSKDIVITPNIFTYMEFKGCDQIKEAKID